MKEHQSPEFGRSIESLTDEELYHEYQYVKEHGPQLRLDEAQLEIAKRWEAHMWGEIDE